MHSDFKPPRSRFAWILVLAMAAGCRFDLPNIDIADAAIDSAPLDVDVFPSLHTDDIFPQFCTDGQIGDPNCPINVLLLDNLVTGGIPGAKFTFVIQNLGYGLYINSIKLVPGPMGAYIEHPLLVEIPVDPMKKPTKGPLDHFSDVKMSLSANADAAMQTIGGGTAFVKFSSSNKLAVFFSVARPL